MVALGESPQPLYLRVYRLIADEIASGNLGPGDRLPSERELTDRLGVSRATVRRALGELATDGLVEASAGRGSFVATGPLVEPPNALLSFTELGSRHGLQATARVLRLESRPPPSRRPRRSASPPGADLVELERLRLLDAVPVAVDATRFPLARVPACATTTSRRLAVRRARGGPASRPSGRRTPSRPSPHRSGRARCSESDLGEPVLVAETAAYDPSDRLVELARTHYRADRYRFRATLVRRR